MKFFLLMIQYTITMKNKTRLKLLLALLLSGTPAIAQTPDNSDKARQERRAKNFAEFLLYWTNWDAYININNAQIKRAEKADMEKAQEEIPQLVLDSTYYANEIVKRADIINKRYDLDETPDMAFAKYELVCAYKQKYPSKDAPEYILGKMLKEYEETLKQLKLARYTVKCNNQQK